MCVYVCENIFQVPDCQCTGKVSYTAGTMDRYRASYHTKTNHIMYHVHCRHSSHVQTAHAHDNEKIIARRIARLIVAVSVFCSTFKLKLMEMQKRRHTNNDGGGKEQQRNS